MFDLYISLGDSMSIDDYSGAGLGAASLLHRNADLVWPEFCGRDLLTLNPACRFHPMARNGATMPVLEQSLPALQPCPGPTLVTISLGGNDLLTGTFQAEAFGERLASAVDYLRSLYPQLTLLFTTVYDPSDGTGYLQSGPEMPPKLQAGLSQLNQLLSQEAHRHGGTCVDTHRHFQGHAIGEDEWLCFNIEPNRRGSAEIRRLWWEALRGS